MNIQGMHTRVTADHFLTMLAYDQDSNYVIEKCAGILNNLRCLRMLRVRILSCSAHGYLLCGRKLR